MSDGDIVGLRKAFLLNHTMWGGRFNPIILAGDLGGQLVSVFRVDVLIPLSEHKGVKEFVEQFSFLPSPLFHSDIFIIPQRCVEAAIFDHGN